MWIALWFGCEPPPAESTPPGDTDPDPVGDADLDGFLVTVDCDDADATVFPGAPEACDGRITDCDRETEDGLVTVGGTTSTDLQAALDAAVEGAEIRVCGTWTGVFVAPVAVSLVGPNGRDTTVLVADGGPALSVRGGTSLTGLTLTGGVADVGGGLQLASEGSLVVTDCAITGNTAERGGGVALFRGAVASFPGTRIDGNTADEGGGIFALEADLDLSDAVIADNVAAQGGGLWVADTDIVGGVVTGNRVEGSGYSLDGGGLFATGAVTVTATELAFNSAASTGGGLRVNDGTLTATGVSIHDNESTYGGGAMVFPGRWTADPTTVVTANTAYEGGGLSLSRAEGSGGELTGNHAVIGGGLSAYESDVDTMVLRGNDADTGGGAAFQGDGTMTGCTVEDNEALDGGGIASLAASTPPANPSQSIVDTDIVGNTATHAGGGIFTTAWERDDHALEVDGTTITDNAAGFGAGLWVEIVPVRISGSTVARNVASYWGGGAELAAGQLMSVDTDWGTGADDNVPDDLNTLSGDAGAYGAGASFTCNAAGCL